MESEKIIETLQDLKNCKKRGSKKIEVTWEQALFLSQNKKGIEKLLNLKFEICEKQIDEFGCFFTNIYIG